MSAELVTANLPYITAIVGAGTVTKYGITFFRYIIKKRIEYRNAVIDERINMKIKGICDQISACALAKDYDELEKKVDELNNMLRRRQYRRRK